MSSAQILAIATETPAAIFGLGTYGGAKRLAGLTWGAEDLPAAIGAATQPRGGWQLHRALRDRPRALPVRRGRGRRGADRDRLSQLSSDLEGLAAYAGRARRDGFTGMMAIHPAQVDVINALSRRARPRSRHARRVVAAFEAQPGAGALSLDGRMIDRPHLVQAQRILAAAGALSRVSPRA